MMRKDAGDIVKQLDKICCAHAAYGTEEISVSAEERRIFYRDSDAAFDINKEDAVSYCMIEENGTIVCYFTVTTQERLEEMAHTATWYGHYNYVCVTKGFCGQMSEALDEYIPGCVGIVVFDDSLQTDKPDIRRRAERLEMTEEEQNIIKTCMVRTLSRRMRAYRDAADADRFSALMNDIDEVARGMNETIEKKEHAEHIIREIKHIARMYLGKEASLEEMLKKYADHEKLLPESVELTLTEEGRKRNEQIKKEADEYWAFYENEDERRKVGAALKRLNQTMRSEELLSYWEGSTSLEKTGFSVRIFSSLKRNGINKISDLEGRRISELNEMRGLDERIVEEIVRKCDELGIHLS